MTSDEFEIVTSCRLAHGLATDQTGNPLEGIVLHADCMNSVDGVAAGMTLFILPEMAREIAQRIPVQLDSLSDPLHTHTSDCGDYLCHYCDAPAHLCFTDDVPCCDACHHGGSMRHRAFANR